MNSVINYHILSIAKRKIIPSAKYGCQSYFSASSWVPPVLEIFALLCPNADPEILPSTVASRTSPPVLEDRHQERLPKEFSPLP
jgi:hypothetical protein